MGGRSRRPGVYIPGGRCEQVWEKIRDGPLRMALHGSEILRDSVQWNPHELDSLTMGGRGAILSDAVNSDGSR